MTAPIRIANCSGFYGDRLAAAREMVDGGPIDVLTGDWLAELTMLILAKNLQRDPAAGYGRTFVTQLEQVMGDCLDRGIKVAVEKGVTFALAVPSTAGSVKLHPFSGFVGLETAEPEIHRPIEGQHVRPEAQHFILIVDAHKRRPRAPWAVVSPCRDRSTHHR